ncbi:MAG: hypothetical protein NZ654_09900, partial [Acidimicrobiales bacterium]|nr:hypothetical protein [Acidimicrobiales bacterium]
AGDPLFERTNPDGESQLKAPARRSVLEQVVRKPVVKPSVADRRIDRNSCYRGIDGPRRAT